MIHLISFSLEAVPHPPPLPKSCNVPMVRYWYYWESSISCHSVHSILRCCLVCSLCKRDLITICSRTTLSSLNKQL